MLFFSCNSFILLTSSSNDGFPSTVFNPNHFFSGLRLLFISLVNVSKSIPPNARCANSSPLNLPANKPESATFIAFFKPTFSTSFLERSSSAWFATIVPSVSPLLIALSRRTATLSKALSKLSVVEDSGSILVLSVHLLIILSTALDISLFSISLSSLSTVAAVLSATLLVAILISAAPESPVFATVSTYFFRSDGSIAVPKPLETSPILSRATSALSAAKTCCDTPSRCTSIPFNFPAATTAPLSPINERCLEVRSLNF